MKITLGYIAVSVVVIGSMGNIASSQSFPGPAGALAGYEVVSETKKVTDHAESVVALCKGGKKVLGGGAQFSTEEGNQKARVVYSYPQNNNGWVAEVKATSGEASLGTLKAFAICATVP
jgi:hypothetical protein